MKELFWVKFNGRTYAGYGDIKSTKNATTEIVEIDEDGVDTISIGKDKWYNRPWYKFQFANALEDAVIKWFGKQASEKIYRAINDSSDCQEAMDKFISSLNVNESYKKRMNESLSGRDRVKFIAKMVDKLTKEPFLYSHEEANDIAIKHADDVSKDWGGYKDMDAYIRADLRQTLTKKDYDAEYGRKNESYKRRIRESMDDYDVNEIAKWIKRTVRWLVSEDCGMGTYDLEHGLAICVGWLDGYDENDETVVHSVSDPSWAIVAGIKVPSSDYMSTDFEFVNFPYFDNGDVWDAMLSIEPNEDYKYLARYLLEEYHDIVKYLDEHNCYIEDDGEIVPYGDEEYEEEDWD